MNMLFPSLIMALGLGYNSLCIFAQSLPQDPLTSGPPLEVIHLFHDMFPSGYAVASSGRTFVGHTRQDVNNANYTVGEITGFDTEVPFPSAEMNTPPNGLVNYSTTPPTGAADPDHFLSEASVVLDAKERLWVLDEGRPASPKGGITLSAEGGPKLVGIDLETNSTFKTIVFNRTVVPAVSRLNDVVFDLRPELTSSGQGVGYITDSSPEGYSGIVTVDLGTGEAWRHVIGSRSVHAEDNFVLTVWGEMVYVNPGKGGSIHSFTTSSDGIALSPDGETLYYSVFPGRHLYSIPTERLRDQSPTAEILAIASIRQLTQKGPSDGFASDSNGNVYFGSFETNSIGVYFPGNGTVGTLVRDPRIGWTDTLWVAGNYLYFTENQNFRSPSQQGGVDRRVKPFVAYRVPLPDGGTNISLK